MFTGSLSLTVPSYSPQPIQNTMKFFALAALFVFTSSPALAVSGTTDTSASAYITEAEVATLFHAWTSGDFTTFFAGVDPNVEWTVVSDAKIKSMALSGVYVSLSRLSSHQVAQPYTKESHWVHRRCPNAAEHQTCNRGAVQCYFHHRTSRTRIFPHMHQYLTLGRTVERLYRCRRDTRSRYSEKWKFLRQQVSMPRPFELMTLVVNEPLHAGSAGFARFPTRR